MTQAAIGSLASGRDSFLGDRAYRLLTAAADGTPVRAIDPTVRDLFQVEKRLGRLPLKDAYGVLAQREPRLIAVADAVARGNWSGDCSDPAHHLPTFIRDHVERLVGIAARGAEPLLQGDLADSIAQQYLLILGGESGYGEADTPFFVSDSRSEIFSSSLFGKKRPRATN